MRKLVWFGWLLLWRLGPLIKNLWFLLKGRGERAIPIQQIQFLSINPINFIQLCWWIDGWWRNEWSWMEEWAQWARAGCLFFSFFSIQQSNSIKNIDWLQLNEEKKGRTAQPTKRSSNNINKPIQEIKIILIYWLELMCWTARLGRPAGGKLFNKLIQSINWFH